MRHPTLTTRSHSKAGYVGLVMKKELRDRIDKLRRPTPWGIETRPEVIARLLDFYEERGESKEERGEPKRKRVDVTEEEARSSLEKAVLFVERKRRKK